MSEKKMFILWSCIILIIFTVWLIYDRDILTTLTKNKPIIENQNNDYRVKEGSHIPTNNITNINDVHSNMKGSIVSIEGVVIEKKAHKNGHQFLVIRDHTGEIDVPIFVDKKINHDKILLNNKYRITGSIDEYNGKLEIIPEKEQDIIEITELYYDNNKISEENLGNEVTIIGTLLTKYNNPDGNIFINIKLSGVDKQISVPIFNNIKYGEENLKINSTITIRGKISKYKGELQVIPQKSEDIKIIER